MNKYNDQGQPHGPFETYYANGKLYYKGNYVNGKSHGLWEGYGAKYFLYLYGKLDEIEYYIT